MISLIWCIPAIILAERFLAHISLIVSTGAVSTTSWYAAIILGTWRSLTLSYVDIMTWYLAILAIILIGANIGISIFGVNLAQPNQFDRSSTI